MEPVGAMDTVAVMDGPVIEETRDPAEPDETGHISFRGYRKMRQSFLMNRNQRSTLIPESVLTLPQRSATVPQFNSLPLW